MFLSKVEELDDEVVHAKEKELSNLEKNDVFKEINYNGQYLISTRWVFTKKIKEGKKIVKARLVARGFEENTESLRKDSPTCSKYSLRLVMLTASSYNWEIGSIDFASAFLQGDPIDREVFVRPPSDVCSPDRVWLLKRCIYGLNDAPRAWYNRIHKELLKTGGIRSKIDSAMYMWYENNKLIGHLVCHVDDLIFAGVKRWFENVIGRLRKMFNIGSESKEAFRYIGLNVRRHASMILLDQQDYIEKLQEITIKAERKKEVQGELTDEERSKLKAVSGQLLWVTTQTRPDMSFESCSVSNAGKTPTVQNLLDANKAIRKMRASNEVKLKFPCIGVMSRAEVVIYADATHASLSDGSSQGAFLVFVKGEGKVAPILWQSKKLKRVTKSPLASETLALGEAADAGLLVMHLVKEIYNLTSMPTIKAYTDSKSLRDALHTSNSVEDLSLRVNIGRLREMINLGEISVHWVEGKKQLADVLTKRGASSENLLRVLDSCML